MKSSGTTKNFGALEKAKKELAGAGIENAEREAEWILEKVSKCFSSPAHFNNEKFWEIIEERKKRKPLAYLLGDAPFWNETLDVDSGCLVPRPETEILVEKVINISKKKFGDCFSFLDMGTGSGAIATAILNSCLKSNGVLADISKEALGCASQNIKKYRLEDRAKLVQTDLFRAFLEREAWDVILVNPPYLSKSDWEKKEPELNYEPSISLFGGSDGLDFYRRIIPEARGRLREKGILVFEVGLGQAGKVCKWLEETEYANIQIIKDYNRIDRVVMASRGS